MAVSIHPQNPLKLVPANITAFTIICGSGPCYFWLYQLMIFEDECTFFICLVEEFAYTDPQGHMYSRLKHFTFYILEWSMIGLLDRALSKR